MVYSRGKFNIQVEECYYCSNCERFHKKYRKSDGKKIQVFIDHAKWAVPKTAAEVWKIQMKKGWRQLAKEQKKTGKPVGLPKREKKRRTWKG